MYVAVASPHGADSKKRSINRLLRLLNSKSAFKVEYQTRIKTKQAYKNSYVKFDLDKMFAEKRPMFWKPFILRIQFWKQ